MPKYIDCDYVASKLEKHYRDRRDIAFDLDDILFVLEKCPAADVVEVAIYKGAMRAYREAFEKAHDEAVADFSHFLIDKAKDGSIDICDLPDLVAEWRSPERKDAELMKDVNAAFDKAAEGLELSSKEKNKESWLRTATGWYDARFRKVE